MLDSVIESDEKYYPQIFLEECKYAQEKIKTKNYIGIELKSESDTDNDNDEQIQKKSKIRRINSLKKYFNTLKPTSIC